LSRWVALAGEPKLLRYTRFVRSHRWIDDTSLALHEAVAAKIELDPRLVDIARDNLERWTAASPQPALLEWRSRLDATPLPQLLALLRSPGDHAARLRQSSLFGGVLSPQERQSMLSRIDALGPFAKHPLTEHVELLPERRVLALQVAHLLLQSRQEGPRGGGQVVRPHDGRRAGPRMVPTFQCSA
jgi:hypothetical protein